jgi:hypothetical protein
VASGALREVTLLGKLFEWVVSSEPATIITAIAAIITAFRLQSNREHKKTMTEIKKVGAQTNGVLTDRLERIERALGISEADQ